MLNRMNRGLSIYNPLHDMEEWERGFFRDPVSFFAGNVGDHFKTDITDEGDSYRLEADLPGFAKEDIHIDVKGDTLTIQAERHSEHEEKDKQDKYIRCERSYGSYSRSFALGDVNADEIRAKYQNGVLTLTLPKIKAQEPESKRLEIE